MPIGGLFPSCMLFGSSQATEMDSPPKSGRVLVKGTPENRPHMSVIEHEGEEADRIPETQFSATTSREPYDGDEHQESPFLDPDAAYASADHGPRQGLKSNGFIQRPQSSGERNDAGFSFGLANMRQIDLVGTRKTSGNPRNTASHPSLTTSQRAPHVRADQTRPQPHRKPLQGLSQHSMSSSEAHQSQSSTSSSHAISHESGGANRKTQQNQDSADPSSEPKATFQGVRESPTAQEPKSSGGGGTLARGAEKKPSSVSQDKADLDKAVGTHPLVPKNKNAQVGSAFANLSFRSMESHHVWEGHTSLESIREEADAMHQSILPGKTSKPSKKRKKQPKSVQSLSSTMSDNVSSPSDAGLPQSMHKFPLSVESSTDVRHQTPPVEALVPNDAREVTSPIPDDIGPDKSQRSSENPVAQISDAPQRLEVGLARDQVTALPAITQNLSSSAKAQTCDSTNQESLSSGSSTRDVPSQVKPSGQTQIKKPSERSTHHERLAGEQKRSLNSKPRPIAAEASKAIADAPLHGISSRGGPSKISKSKITKTLKVGPAPDRDQRSIATDATQEEPPPRKSSAEMFMLLAKVLQDEHEEMERKEAKWEDARNREMECLQVQLEQLALQKENLAAKVKQHESTIQECLSKYEDLKSSKKELECDLNGLQKKHKDLECTHSQIIQDYKHEKELKSKVDEFAKERSRNENLLTQELNAALEKYDSINTTLKAQAESSKKLSERYDSLLVPLNELRNDERLKDHLKECLDLVKSLHSSNSVLPDNIEKLRELIKSLEDSIKSGFDDTRETTVDFQKTASTTEERLTGHLQILKQELSSWETVQKQVTELRENNATLEERSTGLQDRITALQVQLNESQARETELQNSFADLREELACAKAAANSVDESKVRDLEAKNQDLMLQLETARSDVSGKTEQLRILSETEEGLRAESVELKEKLRVSTEKCSQLQTQCDQATENTNKRINELYAQLSKDAKELKEAQDAKHQNEMHQKTQKILQLQGDVDSQAIQLKEMKDLQRKILTNENHILNLNAAKNSANKYLEDLQTRLEKAESERNDKSLEIDTLTKKIKAKDAEFQKLEAERASQVAETQLLRQATEDAETELNEQKRAAEKLKAEHEQAVAEQRQTITNYQEKVEAKNKELQETKDSLETAQESAKKAEASLSLLKKRQESLYKEQQEHLREKDELNEDLREAQSATRDSERELQTAKRNAEDEIKKQSEKYRTDVGELQRRLTEEDQAREEDRLNAQRVQEQHRTDMKQQEQKHQEKCGSLRRRAEVAETKLREFRDQMDAHIKAAEHAFKDSQSGPSNAAGTRTAKASLVTIAGNSLNKSRRVVSHSRSPVNDDQQSSQRENSANVLRAPEEEHQTPVRPGLLVGDDREWDTQELESQPVGSQEILTENGVSIRPGSYEAIPETQFESIPLPAKFSQFNSLHQTPKRHSSDTSSSDLTSLDDWDLPDPPSAYKLLGTNRESSRSQQAVPRASRENNVSPPSQERPRQTQQTQQFENPFTNFDRPQSQANTSARVGRTPSVQRDSRTPANSSAGPQFASSQDKQGQSAKGSSSPDYIARGPKGSNKMFTYNHTARGPRNPTPGPSRTNSQADYPEQTSQRRGVLKRPAASESPGSTGNKRVKDKHNSSQLSGTNSLGTHVPETQSQSQVRLSQPSETPRRSHPAIQRSTQTRMRSSAAAASPTSRRTTNRSTRRSSQQRYELRFSRELDSS